MNRILYRSFSQLRGDRAVWGLFANRLRILCYHGVCQDDTAAEAWVPGFFVTESAFERQLMYLQKNALVLPLREAVSRLHDGSLPPCSVSLTFDDGYANNLDLAYRLLERYRMHATVFISSAYVESGELYPFLKLQFVKRNRRATTSAPDYKSEPLDEVTRWIDNEWPSIRPSLTDHQWRTLQPMTPHDVKKADPQFIEFGAHTHTHCILRNETADRRQQEIRSSIRKVTQWAGYPVKLFSYPNGERGDFGEPDKDVLRSEGIEAAVSGIRGLNSSRSDLFELRRYPVGLYHDNDAFCAEVTGFRAAVLAAGKGWRREG